MLCFRYTSNKRLDMFLFSGPSNTATNGNNGYEWICISNFVSVLTVCMCARMSVSGGILPVDVFILLFVAHCILFLRVRIFFSRAFDKNENGSFVPNEFFSTFFLNAKTIVLVSMVAS